MPFECTVDGCGLIVGMTVSYQPLGTADVYVDGQLVAHAVSNAEPNWALARSPEWTINRFHTVVAPLGEGSASGLAAGRHLLTVVCRGETLPELAHLPTNYSRHEVHVRGVVVIYTSISSAARQRRRLPRDMKVRRGGRTARVRERGRGSWARLPRRAEL